MSDRYPGGIITKTPVTPAGPYEDSAAPGIWTLEQQAYYKAQGLWPIAGNIQPDPYYEYVTMLLTGNGTNGAQNNTFVDSSTNAFTITRNGNTTQGSFSPYGSLWSNYFDGDDLETNTTSAFAMGTGDFTIECWCFVDGTQTYYPVAISIGSGNTNATQDVYFGYNGGQFFAGNYSTGEITSSASIKLTTWYHVAVVRSSGTLKLYVNGVFQSSRAYSSNFASNSFVRVGVLKSDYGTFYWGGNISNVRVVKGTAVYTSDFTPSTTPLTAISGTVLLTCQSNRFVDNSSTSATFIIGSTPSVQRFSPFNPTASYSTATIGGSMYGDGAGDFITIEGNSSIYPASTSTPFTLEAWIYPTTDTYNYIISSYFDGTVKYALMLGASPDSPATGATTPLLGKYDGGWSTLTSSTSVKLNCWTHIAAVFTGSTCKLFINGVNTDTGGPSSWTTAGSSTNVRIGARWDGSTSSNQFTGYICDARIVMGSAVYSANFTPNTTPLTAVTNTKALCNMTNAGIPDSAMMNDLETVGNAQISTTQSKFGGSSIAFDGSGDYLTTVAQPTNSLGTRDFTLEFWVYINSLGSPQGFVGNMTESGSTGYSIYVQADNTVRFQYGGSYITSTNTLAANNWYHIAVVKYGSTVTVYVNGSAWVSGTVTTNLSSTTTIIGRAYTDADNYYLNGYIDDFRITKGYARYTANFTPPTSAFPTF